MSEIKQQVESIKELFDHEFKLFAGMQISDLNLAEAENYQRELSELKTKHTGKKSEIANAKKLIGKVPPEERGEFGQFVQSVEKDISSAIENS